MNPPIVFLGAPIDHLDMHECLERIGQLVKHGRASGRTHQVATVNVDFLVNALDDPKLLRILQNCSLNIADGMPIVWASGLMGASLSERVAGSDLVPLLAAESARHGWRVHFFGGADGVAERARQLALERHPGAMITADGGPVISDPSEVSEELLDSIREAAPDIVCVALGNPKQERFIAAHAEALGCPVMMGVGGSFDMMLGDKRRAPQWVQRVGAEWVFRAAQEPGRLGRRYARDCTVFGPRLASYARRVRRHRSGQDLEIVVVDDLIRIRRPAVPSSLPVDWAHVMSSLVAARSIELDATDLGSVTPESHAALVGLVRAGAQSGVPLFTGAWSPAFVDCLADFGTGEWLSARFERDR